MPPRRPHGKSETTASGADEVAGEVPAEEQPPRRARVRRADATAPRPDESGVDPDTLDERERRQRASRKAAGPSGNRLTGDDVVVETRSVEDARPTDPR